MITYKMITSYEELPIGQCVRLYKANEIEDDLDKVAEILAILTGKTADEVLAMPIFEFKELQRQAAWVWDDPQAAKPKERYIIGGVPCRLTQSVGAMTAAQFIDFQNCATNDGGIVDVLAVALVPEGKTYGNGYDYDRFKQDIADTLMTPDALAILPFFVASLLKSCATALSSSGKILRKQARQSKNKEMQKEARNLLYTADLLTSGAGGRLWRLWQR